MNVLRSIRSSTCPTARASRQSAARCTKGHTPSPWPFSATRTTRRCTCTTRPAPRAAPRRGRRRLVVAHLQGLWEAAALAPRRTARETPMCASQTHPRGPTARFPSTGPETARMGCGSYFGWLATWLAGWLAAGWLAGRLAAPLLAGDRATWEGDRENRRRQGNWVTRLILLASFFVFREIRERKECGPRDKFKPAAAVHSCNRCGCGGVGDDLEDSGDMAGSDRTAVGAACRTKGAAACAQPSPAARLRRGTVPPLRRTFGAPGPSRTTARRPHWPPPPPSSPPSLGRR